MFEETTYLEFLAISKRQQTLVKHKKTKRRINIGKIHESIIEEPILDEKRSKLANLVEVGIVFNQATLDKERNEENDILRIERRILELEE